MKRMIVYCLILFLLVLAPQAWAGWFGFGGTEKTDEPTTMPSFALVELPAGEDFDSAQLQGKVVLVNFWATWCGPCVAEYPDLMQLHTAYSSKGFTVVGLSMDKSAGSVKRFMEKAGAVYPMLMGNSAISRDFGAGAGLPVSFLIDRQGRIVKKYLGGRPFSEFAGDVELLL
ncbi:MAG: TlpA disulfide reductase family protein [Desulfobulbaceae bacterium]|jgi:thiol-disulfide isomerase/thioredoxin|nr:TlpA disulfide reductase family protein [Desulfobulbaceae bacterium]